MSYTRNSDGTQLSGAPFVLVEGEGFEPSKAEPSDLQSDPFGRSGTPPKETEYYGDFPHLCQTVGRIICFTRGGDAAVAQIRYHGERFATLNASAFPALHNILNPRSVAIIGASESADKFGGRVMRFVLKHGFKGTILPIHPTSPTLLVQVRSDA